MASSGVQLQVLLGEVQIGLAVLALLPVLEDHPYWFSLESSLDELKSVRLDFSTWFSFSFYKGTVCGFYILSFHRKFVTDWCGEPASPRRC